MQASHKVIFNTGVTYFRAFITVFVSLYSTKLIIKTLGVEDFGLYSLVGGVVGLLAFFKSALTSSTQRFISFYLGKGLMEEIKKIIANSFLIHIITGFIIVLIVELVGQYFIVNKLLIPEGRLETAIIIFHFVVASTFITIVTVPFDAILNAHENMLVLAVLGIIETVLKLLVAITLTYIVSYDKLIVYSVLLFSVLLSINIIKWIFCYMKYLETRVSLLKDLDLSEIKKQTSFAGWNLFGAACSMGRGHGVAIISNMFFGTTVNAAFGVANQVKSQVSFFSVTILRAINPQIMKSEGANDRLRMLRLSMMASKFGFFLIAFIAIPLIFEMDNIIYLWLNKTPKYVVVFCQLLLVGAVIEQLTIGIKSAIQSVGVIKNYMILTGGLLLLNMPISYYLLSLGYRAEVVLYVYIAIELLSGILRIYLTEKIIGNLIDSYLKDVILKILLPTTLSISACIFMTKFNNFSFIYTFILASGLFLLAAYFIGLSKNEKRIIDSITLRIIKK